MPWADASTGRPARYRPAEWSVDDGGAERRLRQRARFHPKGFAGRLYRYALLPVHSLIFRTLARRLAAAAELVRPA